MNLALDQRLHAAIEAAEQAAQVLCKWHSQSDLGITQKEDDSPVTHADLAANEIILSHLISSFPEDGILSEESADSENRFSKKYVWVIDPLDGTKDYIAKTGEFSVNIALIHEHQVVLGVIAVPLKKSLYYALQGRGAFCRYDGKDTPINVSQRTTNLIALKSRFHVRENEALYFATHRDKIPEVRTCGSAYKACLIACGDADLAIKMSSGTKEWDVAASVILIQEAGGVFLTPYGAPLLFNRRDVVNRDGYLIMNAMHKDLLIVKKT
jgi:3'(2'), 5'-bisphosphate nucleotidase